MSELFDSTLDAVFRGMDVRSRRQSILAANIANIDTPNFVPKDLDFQAALKQATASHESSEMARTDGRHFGGALGGEAGSEPQVVSRPDRPAGSDGNAVDLDRQMAQAALNSTMYGAMARAAQKKIALLKYVIQQ